MTLDHEKVKTTCPRDCYDACGITVIKKAGKISKVIGDPDHPIAKGTLCGKCAIAYNGAWQDPALRLASPLKRVGTKGRSEFVPISWEQALSEIADRLNTIVDEGNASSILHTHYTGTVGLIGGWYPIRFFNRLGATEIDPDTVCNKAGHAALELVFGNSLEGFDPRTVKDSRTVLIWGANPSHSAPHQDRHWLKSARESGARIIVVDPIGHDSARAADIHLKLRPGTDAALAFAFLHVMRRADLEDKEFIASYVDGAQDLDDAIDQMTPDRAELLCGIPATLIEEAAKAYATGPSLLWLGQGVQRQPSGGNVFRALSALVAFSGNLGKVGAGFLYMNGPSGRGIDMATLTCPSLIHDAPSSVSHMDFAALLEDRERARVLFNWNNNPAASSPEQGRLRRALERTDLFHVAIDLFHTDTTAYADIVLPAASFLEANDLILSYFDLTLSAQVKAVDAPGDALSNQEIFRRLAAAMKYEEEELFESDADLLSRLLKQTPYSGSFDELAKIGTIQLFSTPRVQFQDLRFATSTGRIELASQRAIELGLPKAPIPHADNRPASGKLRILSPASYWQMNSSYGNDATIKQKLGRPTVTVHPEDAASNGLSEGDGVELSNDNGHLRLLVNISDIAQPGTAIVYKGRWPSSSIGDANVNVLVGAQKSDLAESTSVHGTEASISSVSS